MGAVRSARDQWRSQPDIWSCKMTNANGQCKFFCVYRPYKEPISKEMNNNHLNLHLHDQMSGWLRESRSVALVSRLGILVTGAWFCAHGKQ